jgi:hypothetical protein
MNIEGEEEVATTTTFKMLSQHSTWETEENLREDS